MDFLKNTKAKEIRFIKSLLIILAVSVCFLFGNGLANAADVEDWDTIGGGWWTGSVVPSEVNGTDNFYYYSSVDVGLDGWLSSVQLRLKQNQNACAPDKMFRVVVRNYVSESEYGSIIGWSDYEQCNELPLYTDSPIPLSNFELEGLNRISLYFDNGQRFWLGIEFLDGEVGTGNTFVFGWLNSIAYEQLYCDNEDCDISTYSYPFYGFEMRTWVDVDTPEPITPNLPDVVACLPHNYIPPDQPGDIGDLNAIAENLYQYLADIPIIGDALFINCVIYLNFYSELESITTDDIPFHINIFDIDTTIDVPLEDVRIALEDWVADIDGYDNFRVLITTFIWAIIAFGLYFALLHPSSGGGHTEKHVVVSHYNDDDND